MTNNPIAKLVPINCLYLVKIEDEFEVITNNDLQGMEFDFLLRSQYFCLEIVENEGKEEGIGRDNRKKKSKWGWQRSPKGNKTNIQEFGI